ncbi:MAG: proteinPredicted hydrolase of superfamily [Microvirga sp.]|nr:proteinPredicted hydrolase of superfamily [Microvirga sp.]
MSFVVPPTLALHALMHEAGESTCGDMPGPLKALCPDFKKIEKRCEAALFQKFKVVVRDDEQIKHFDRVMLATERRDLIPWRGELWGDIDELAPLQEEISPWPPETAAERFLRPVP